MRHTLGGLRASARRFEDYCRSVLATLLFVSNFYFWSTAGYFEAAAESKPLLHTWSLGVEEQFYILLPILVVAVARYRPRWMAGVIVVVTLVSFTASQLILADHPDAAFYSPLTRVWELTAGVLLAMATLRDGEPGHLRPSKLVCEVSAGAGLTAIVWACLTYNGEMAFPGLAALTPVLGALAIIWSGGHHPTLVGRLLSLRPVVLIGLMSYSLYLWHWPVIVYLNFTGLPFAIPFLPAGSGAVRHGAAIILSFAIAFASWQLVEKPFRKRGPRGLNGTQISWTAGVASAAVAAICIGGMISNGFEGRFRPEAVQVAAFLDYEPMDPTRPACFVDDGDRVFDDARCLKAETGRANYLMMGDSHAAALWPGFHDPERDANVMFAGATGCRPTRTQPAEADGACGALIARMYAEVVTQPDVDGVILAGRWRRSDLDRLEQSLQVLRSTGKDVLLIGPIPEYDAPLPRLLAMAIQTGEADLPQAHLRRQVWAVDAEMRAIAARAGVRYISLVDTLCAAGPCQVFAGGGEPLQYDYGHLTRAGAAFVVAEARVRLPGEAAGARP